MVHQRLLSAGLTGHLCHQTQGSSLHMSLAPLPSEESLSSIPASFSCAASPVPVSSHCLLHGHWRWSQLTEITRNPHFAIPAEHKETQKKAGQTVLRPSTFRWGTESSTAGQRRTNSPCISQLIRGSITLEGVLGANQTRTETSAGEGTSPQGLPALQIKLFK